MAIAYRSGSSAGSGDNGNVTINTPAGVQNDDILVAFLYREGGTWTLPAGWTQVAEVRDRDNVLWLTIVWKRAASEGTSYIFQIASGVWRTLVMGAFSGCITSGSPVDVSATYNAPTATSYAVTGASITTTVNNTMNVVGMANVQGDNITAGSSGYSAGAELGGVELWYLAQASAGASGAKVFSNTNFTARWATIHLALKEPAAGGATVTGAATVVGTGGAAGAALNIALAAGLLAGSGGQAGAALLIIPGAGNMAGAGSLAGAALLIVPGAGVLSGTGALTGTGENLGQVVLGQAAISGVAGLAGGATVIVFGAGNLAGSAAAVSSANVTALAVAQIIASGVLAAAGNVINPNIVTPDSRIYIVLPEVRVVTVDGESRVIVILAESRAVSVGDEDRVYIIPAESRVFTVEPGE